MKNDLSQKYIDNFNSALDVYENSYSHEYLIDLLKNGSIAQKQAAVISLKTINNIDDAEIFISNLTGCDGKIREAVSFRLKDLSTKTPELFIGFDEKYLDAIIDINGNICRNTIEAIKYFKPYQKFTNNFCPKLIQKTLEIIPPIKTFDIQEGKYKINKEVFKLYWYLETISEFVEFIDTKELCKILSDTKDVNDYTIREKTAKILSKLQPNEILSKIKNQLSQDQNYYVRRVSK